MMSPGNNKYLYLLLSCRCSVKFELFRFLSLFCLLLRVKSSSLFSFCLLSHHLLLWLLLFISWSVEHLSLSLSLSVSFSFCVTAVDQCWCHLSGSRHVFDSVYVFPWQQASHICIFSSPALSALFIHSSAVFTLICLTLSESYPLLFST